MKMIAVKFVALISDLITLILVYLVANKFRTAPGPYTGPVTCNDNRLISSVNSLVVLAECWPPRQFQLLVVTGLLTDSLFIIVYSRVRSYQEVYPDPRCVHASFVLFSTFPVHDCNIRSSTCTVTNSVKTDSETTNICPTLNLVILCAILKMWIRLECCLSHLSTNPVLRSSRHSRLLVMRTFSIKGSSGSFTVNMPSPTTKSWERGAKMVKNTDTKNQYLEHIRDTHDPSQHLKTLEDELKGTMGKALGNQGQKLLQVIHRMNQERERYEGILASIYNDTDAVGHSSASELRSAGLPLDLSEMVKVSLVTIVQNHNRLRKDAITARWELLVHRQAVGFITNNHKFVDDNFPIPQVLILPGKAEDWEDYEVEGKDAQTKCQQAAKEAESTKFGDQLDWWERIGRWR